MKITTIIFDLGNVLLTNDWHCGVEEKFQEYSDYFNITYDDMERGWKASFFDFMTGKISEDEFWRIFLQVAGANIIDIEHAKKLWRKYQRPIENVLGLLKKIKESNRYQLSALTTVSREWLDFKREKYDLDSFFEEIVSSGYSGLIKPDVGIYKLLLEKINKKPEECLFIDDSEKNLLPAKEIGMKTILFTNQEELERNLIELGVL